MAALNILVGKFLKAVHTAGRDVGAGAVGAFYASRLHQPEANVHASVVCRSNYEAVKSKGFRLQTRSFGEYSFVPSAVFPSTAAAAQGAPDGGYDHVVLATKALPDIVDESKDIEPVVTVGRTAIVLIQNGVGIEEPHHARFPNNPILSAVTVISAAQTEPGLVIQHRWTRISIGAYPPPSSTDSAPVKALATRSEAALARLVDTFKAGGIADAESWDSVEMQLVRWHKIAINATFNPSSVLSGGCGNADMLADPTLRAHCVACMEEVFSTAQKMFGRKFPDELATIEAIVKSSERNKGSKPSMLLDWEAGRAMELEVILGNPIRIAERQGYVMPRLQSMYGLLRMMAVRRGTQMPRSKI
ncbi:hypothetical protein HKX48_002530 [Thoreauomyces humboldtii]|nr:hypothetical protein HKX48_002530 [Thoreauomyces humboldtii]